jgi:hypothetical protein
MTEYIFSDNQEDNEYYRLRLLEEAFDKKTKIILRGAGLKERWKCLEIGPCAGSILDIDKIDSEIHLEFGGPAVAKVMSASTEALKEKYIETGECSEDDVGTYIKGAKDPRSLASYYATMSIVGIKT